MAQASPARRMGVNIFDESKPMWQIMLVFLIPLMISNILQSASQTFASIFLGRMIGVDALAAVSAVFPVVFLLFSFLIGIASGSTVLIGQAHGAHDEHRVKKVAGTVLGATMIFAVFVAVFGTLVSPWMLQALGTPAAILAQSDAYTRVIFLTAPIIFPYLVYTTFLRGVGDSQTPLYFLIVSSVLAVFFTPAFIQGWFGLPHLGVVSAAVSAMIANLVGLIGLLFLLARRKSPLAFDLEMAQDMVPNLMILWNVIRIGVATGIQVIMVSLAEIAIISFVNHYGPRATAAYGAVNQIVNYVQFPAISIGIAASIFGAQCIGARREDKLGSVIRSAVALNYLVGGILVTLCYLLATQLLQLFITDAPTVRIAHELLMITLWSYLVFGNSAVISGVMRSSGTVLVPTINGLIGIWLLEVPVAYFCMKHFGLPGVWVGYPAYYCFMLCAQFTYYEFFWKKKTHERLV
ncbi:MAG TPA: MATE family efflux transporter [Candidatus Baltobacteraceae bacterium]|nr:MATE family efflux transporter [Candidatus Baltobacteraceae bacterium]